MTQLRHAGLAESERHAPRQFFAPHATFDAVQAAQAGDRPTLVWKQGVVHAATSGSRPQGTEQSVDFPSNSGAFMIG